MSYRLQTSRRKKASPFVFFAFCVFLIATVLFTPLSSAMRYLSSKIGGDALVGNILSWADSKKSLLQEREDLKNKIAELEAIRLERDALLDENAELKEMEIEEDEMIATVLLRPGFSPFDVLSISRGSDDGVALGDLVLYHSLVIGEISELGNKTSKATLFSSSGKTFPVRLAGVEAEAHGLGGGSFLVMLPKNVEVELEDPVTLSSERPRVFGRVEDIIEEEHDTFKRVLFALPINVNEIRFVNIEKREL